MSGLGCLKKWVTCRRRQLFPKKKKQQEVGGGAWRVGRSGRVSDKAQIHVVRGKRRGCVTGIHATKKKKRIGLFGERLWTSAVSLWLLLEMRFMVILATTRAAKKGVIEEIAHFAALLHISSLWELIRLLVLQIRQTLLLVGELFLEAVADSGEMRVEGKFASVVFEKYWGSLICSLAFLDFSPPFVGCQGVSGDLLTLCRVSLCVRYSQCLGVKFPSCTVKGRECTVLLSSASSRFWKGTCWNNESFVSKKV